MKSGRQRREELRQKRLERAKRLEERLRASPHGMAWPGAGVVDADRALLARHNNTYATLPAFYVDTIFTCRDCGQEQVWTARQQKWWYEERLGPIDSTAVRCLPCRRARRTQRAHPGANLLGERRDRLRALGTHKPDADARAEVEAALADKWWGLRTTAIATLGDWGDVDSVERLKALLAAHAGRDDWNSWNRQARAAMFKSLGACLPDAEADWALAEYLGTGEAAALRDGLARQLPAFWEPVIDAEWRRGEPRRLERLIWVLPKVEADPARQRRWRERFEAHPDAGVRRCAEWAWRPR